MASAKSVNLVLDPCARKQRVGRRCAKDYLVLCVQVQVPATRVTAMAFSPAGASLALACWGGSVCLYHAAASNGSGQPSLKAAAAGSAAAAATAAVSLPRTRQAGELEPAVAAPDAAAEAACSGAAAHIPALAIAATGQVLGAPLLEQSEAVEAAAAVTAHGTAVVPSPRDSSAEQPAAEAAHAPGLAAIDHGIRGSGGWTVGCRCGTAHLVPSPCRMILVLRPQAPASTPLPSMLHS